jgi:F0F1-type ATP synthase membrane subunit b/b'
MMAYYAGDDSSPVRAAVPVTGRRATPAQRRHLVSPKKDHHRQAAPLPQPQQQLPGDDTTPRLRPRSVPTSTWTSTVPSAGSSFTNGGGRIPPQPADGEAVHRPYVNPEDLPASTTQRAQLAQGLPLPDYSPHGSRAPSFGQPQRSPPRDQQQAAVPHAADWNWSVPPQDLSHTTRPAHADQPHYDEPNYHEHGHHHHHDPAANHHFYEPQQDGKQQNHDRDEEVMELEQEVSHLRSQLQHERERANSAEAAQRLAAQHVASDADADRRIAQLEAQLDAERREHREALRRIADQSAGEIAGALLDKRELESRLSDQQHRLDAVTAELELMKTRVDALSAALVTERADASAMMTSYRERLSSAMAMPLSQPSGYSVPFQQAHTSIFNTSATHSQPYAQGAPLDAAFRKSPPRQQQQHQQQHTNFQAYAPQAVPATPPPTARREAPAPLRTPPRGGSTATNDHYHHQHYQQQQQQQQQPPPPSPTRQQVRDKNEKAATVDPTEVDSLEHKLYDLSSERDAIDLQLRKVEHVRVRSIADKAKKETLSRRLADLNQAISGVRKRLRDLSALER